VRVLEVNLEKNQIALTMKSGADVQREQPRERAATANGPQQRKPPRQQDARPPRRDKPQERKREERKPPAFNNPFAEQLAKWKKS